MMLEGETLVKATLSPPMDLDLRLEAQDEEGLQHAEANEPLELLGLDPERSSATVKVKTKMSPSMIGAMRTGLE